jgi:hypothetical protein
MCRWRRCTLCTSVEAAQRNKYHAETASLLGVHLPIAIQPTHRAKSILRRTHGSGSIKAERRDDGRFLAHGYDGCAGGNRAWPWQPPIIAWVDYARASTKPGTVDGAAATSHDWRAARRQRSVSVHANGDKLVGRTGNDTLGGIRTMPTYSGTTGAGDRILPGVEGLAWTPSTSSC